MLGLIFISHIVKINPRTSAIFRSSSNDFISHIVKINPPFLL